MCTANQNEQIDAAISTRIEPRGPATNLTLLLVGVIVLNAMGIASTVASVYVALTTTSRAVSFLTLVAILSFTFGGMVLQAFLDRRNRAKLTSARSQ